MWISRLFFDVWPVLVLGVGFIAMFLLGHLTHTSACRSGCTHDPDASGVVEPQIPRFGKPRSEIYNPRHHVTGQRCIGPYCEHPELTAGQVVMVVEMGRDMVYICLDCAPIPKMQAVLSG